MIMLITPESDMKSNLRISVIIPLYNRGEYIKRAIDSVITQTYQNFEIIIVDGHSSDEGPSIVRSIKDSRIIFFEQEGKGLAIARNQGVNRANNNFIAFLDADDEWSPEHLDTLTHLHEKFPNAGICATTYKRIDYENIAVMPKFRDIPPPPWEGLIPNYFLAVTSGDSPFIPTSVGLPKDVVIDVGAFTPGVQWGEDDDLWIRIALKYPIAYSWSGEAIWHCEANNRITENIPITTREMVVERGLSALANNSVKSGDIPYVREYVAKFELNRALWNIKAGNLKIARTILKDCETVRFKSRKNQLLIFSYIPVPVFRFIWNTLREIKTIFVKNKEGEIRRRD
jgi:glycosyltransferase involved in cell wall biosynthesis